MIRVIKHGEITQFKFYKRIMSRFRTPYCTSAFLVDGLMIDTGGACCQNELHRLLRERKFKIEQIVCTHHHEDHIGNARYLQQYFNVPIYAHPSAVKFMAEPMLMEMEWYRRLLWQEPESVEALVCPKTLTTDSFNFEVFETPGHSQDHLVIYQPQRKWLFSGDIFLGIHVKHTYRDEDIITTLDSLRKLQVLPIDKIFCSLQGKVENGDLAIKNKIAFLEQVQAKAAIYHQAGYSYKEISDMLLGSEGLKKMISQGDYSKVNLIRSLLQD